jgi:TolB-like protein/Tfp pilus assembly protein PilF
VSKTYFHRAFIFNDIHLRLFPLQPTFVYARLSRRFWTKMADDPRPTRLLPEQLAAVRDHLQDVLSSDAFKGGKRAQEFLQVVVEHALAGRLDSLRERMLGAEMFGRPIDYDTGNDSVVRVKASEVRRRLAEYYRKLQTPPAVRIELPTGTYVPQFIWAPKDDLFAQTQTTEPASSPLESDQPEEDRPVSTAPARISGFSFHNREFLFSVAVSLAVAGIFGVYLWRNSPERNQIRSIAILPLANLSGDPNQEYFADGMTEELTRDLAKIRSLRVISQASAMTFKGTKEPLSQIAHKLAVDGIVEGSIEREGDRVRIAIQLYDAKADQQVWAQPYVREMNSVLEMQSDVARGIADQIELKLTSPEEARLSRSRPINPEALDLYLQGMEQLNTVNPKSATELFRRAIEKDPSYSAPHAALAEVYDLLAERGLMPGDEASSQEKAEALKAIELDGSRPDGHLALGLAALYGSWDWNTLQRELARAKELDPNSARVHWAYSTYFNMIGRQDEALAEAKLAQQFDPVSARSFINLAIIYVALRQYDQAAIQIDQAKELDKDRGEHMILPGIVYAEQGRYDDAIQVLQKLGDSPIPLGLLGNVYARTGRTAEARATISKLENQLEKSGVGRYEIAMIFVGLKDPDNAFKWLDKACQAHEYLTVLIKVEPTIDPLRSDPRFQDLIRRIGFPEN